MKRKIIKHPIYFFAVLEILVLFLIPAIVFNLNQIIDLSTTLNAIIGVIIGLIAFIGIVLYFKNGNKYMKQEKKERLKKIKRNAFNDKKFILIKERHILSNFVFCYGLLFVYVMWLLLMPIQRFNGIEYWILRASSVLIIVIGGIGSFRKPKKMLVYKNGKLRIISNGENLVIKPSELLEYKKDFKNTNATSQRVNLYFDMVLYLQNKEIILKKADCCLFFRDILQQLKNIEEQDKNY